MASALPIKKLAIVVGGGPAPGINGVISAVTIEALNRDIQVFGIQDGYKYLVQGDSSHIRPLSKDDVKEKYIRGGSMLGTSRTNPTKKAEDMANVLKVLEENAFDALVSIGGDDTAYTASQVYAKFKEQGGKMRVAHVPKTIDNDLPLPGSTPTFGFETARHYGVSTVRNLAEDARTTSRWYLVVSMGRAAGHLALGIGKAAAATLTIIAEEFGMDADNKPNKTTFKHLCDIILGSILKRRAAGKQYGVVVLAEGLIESVKDELKDILDKTHGKYGNYETDDHGHLRLGEIEFGGLIRDLLSESLLDPADERKKRRKPDLTIEELTPLHQILKIKTTPMCNPVTFITKDLGYELRCADPIPFDAEYTRDLGYSAVKFLHLDEATQYGAIIGFIQGNMMPMKFDDMLDPKTKRMATRNVNTGGEGYEVARRYMIRLEKRDQENAELMQSICEVLKWPQDQFLAEFGYLMA